MECWSDSKAGREKIVEPGRRLRRRWVWIIVLCVGVAGCAHVAPPSGSTQTLPVRCGKTHTGNAWFEASGTGTVSESESPRKARLLAQENALRHGLACTGVTVSSSVLSFHSESQSSSGNRFLRISSNLVLLENRNVVSMRVISHRCRLLPGDQGIACRVRIHGTVFHRGRPDPSFTVHVGGFRPGYRDGQKIRLTLKVSRKARIYLFSMDETGTLDLLFPNPYNDSNTIPPGTAVVFPDSESGFKMNALLPPHRRKVTEAFVVVATKGERLIRPDALVKQGSEGVYLFPVGTWEEFMKRLAQLKRNQWTMDILPYVIVK